MARAYGQIMSAIWNDPDFRDLTGAAQRVYLMLVTQADISSSGVLPLTVSRWSKYATDTTSDALWDALSELEKLSYIAHDTETEEVLVRKFVKWDGGYKNQHRRLAVTAAANVVMSQRLRGVLAIQLDELGVPHALSDALSQSPSQAPWQGAWQGAWQAPRVVVTEGELDPQPTTQILEREPGPIGDADPPSTFCSKHPTGTEKPCGPCGTAKLRAAAWAKAEPERRSRAAADRFAAIDACSSCDPDGWLLADTGEASAIRCDHRWVPAP